MASTQGLSETMDKLDVGAVGLVQNDEPEVDEEDSADEGQDLAGTNTSSKKKKKKKPKKKVSLISWLCPHELTNTESSCKSTTWLCTAGNPCTSPRNRRREIKVAEPTRSRCPTIWTSSGRTGGREGLSSLSRP
jgi:hypothetical protein